MTEVKEYRSPLIIVYEDYFYIWKENYLTFHKENGEVIASVDLRKWTRTGEVSDKTDKN